MDSHGHRYESDDEKRAYRQLDGINKIITNDKYLWVYTGLTRKQFEYLLKLVRDYIIKNGKGDLWRLDSDELFDPDNYYLLSPKQALLLLLTRLRMSVTPAYLESEFEIDQISISVYMCRIINMLEEMLPTGKRMMSCLDGMTDKSQITELIPEFDNIVLVDETQVRMRRPGDADERSAAYRGKKKTTTFNMIVYTTTSGVILGDERCQTRY